MTGGGRRGGRSRGRGGGRGGGYGNGQHVQGQPNPVEFYLFASEQFDMTGCPAIVKPPSVPDARARLAMPDRQVLGDIVLWFAASAVAEPTATLAMWQATRQDKQWLSGYVEQSVPQLEVGELMLGPSQKYMQFKLRSGLVPVPPPPPPPAVAAAHTAATEAVPAAAAASSNGSSAPSAGGAPVEQKKQPAPAAAAPDKRGEEQQVLTAVQHAAKDATAKLAAAGKAAHEAAVGAEHNAAKAVSNAAAAAGAATKDAAEAVSTKATTAAVAVKEGLTEARQQLHGAADTASDKARTWLDAVQTDGSNQQMLAIAGAATAAVLAVVGVAVTMLVGRKRK